MSRFVGNDNVEALGATNQPDGQITKNLSTPSRKNIPLNPSGKSALLACASHPMRGALRNVTNARWDAVDAKCATDECVTRTAKSCGPGAAVLALSVREISCR
jgi:hypothetical protein